MERYQVVHSIGSGSFGHVSLGYDKTTNRKVALKRISKGNKEEQEIKSLRKEYEIQKDLHHPNIIQMLDSYETDDALVVVTELAHYDLSKLISKADGKTLPVPEIQKIACDLLSAIHFLHSRSILHRDIKPQNILIGYDKKAKLCDFGFARSVGIQSYLLTSMKGTPLYMAPEIVHGKPYDHNADLWSLGCILYELLMGRPPFFTTSLGELYKKVTIENIVWPEHISGDCLNILQRLLEKEPKKRLTWPDLLYHPFVCGKLNMLESDAQKGLTKALSPSQEIAKEMERQALTRKLVAYNKQRERYQKKAEKAEKKLGIYSEDSKGGFKALFPVPANGGHIAKQVTAMVPFKPSHVRLQQEAYHDIAAPSAKAAAHRNCKIQDDGNSHRKKAEKRQQVKIKVQHEDCEESNTSSCETMTSSSDECETESEDGDDYDTKTVIQDKRLEPIPRESSSTESCFEKHETKYPQQPQQQVISVEILSSRNNTKSDLASSQCESNSLCKSSVNFALSVSKNCCPIITEEWLYFLMTTMKEALDNPNSLCQKHFLTMVLAPLKNTTTEPEVVEKIAVLLSLPFTLDESIHEIAPGLISNLQTLYVETKVLPHLLYTCKLMVINRVKGLSLTLEDICSMLTMEDLEALEKLLRVVTFLVHIDNEYVTQFCDGVLVLHACPVFQLCLKLDGIKPGLAADTVAILCHLLRTSPNNKSIVEEVLLGVKEQNKTEDSLNSRNELWRLISHKNPAIQSRSIRVFTYLCLNSERVKTEFFDKQKSNVWKILRRASISSHAEVRETAEFSLQALNYKSNSNSNITVKSENSSTFNNSVGLTCTTAMMVDDNIADSVTSITAGCDQLDINEKNNESLIVDISELQHEDDKHLTTEYTTSSLHDSGSASANDSSR